MLRPVASEQEIITKIAQLYGFDVVKVKQLDGYDDLNFYVEIKQSDDIPSFKYVCKVMNSSDSKETALIDSQHKLMMHLANRGMSVPMPLMNKTKQYYSTETFENQVSQHVFRLFTFVEGSKLDASLPSPKLYKDVGTLAGILFTELQDYDDAVIRSRKYLWMLESVPQLRSYWFAVEDLKKRDLVSSVVEAFEQRVVPVMSRLGLCAIHGDLNEHNILVDGSNVIGLIDFGDVCYAPPLFEIAICMAYMIIHSKDVSAGRDVLEGYGSFRKLSGVEMDLLKVCVCARLVQSLVLGCYSAREAPTNQYILSSQENGWPLLEKIWSLTDEQAKICWGLDDTNRNRQV